MSGGEVVPRTDPAPTWIGAMRRHLADLRDGTHGPAGEATRRPEKEALFVDTVELIDPVVRRVLAEADAGLLLGAGTISFDGPQRDSGGGLIATWTLTWPAQIAAEIAPVTITAWYGMGFEHPHLRGGTVDDWPLNVFDADQAEAEAPTLRAIVAADIHNLVFEADYRIIAAATAVAPLSDAMTAGRRAACDAD